MVFAPIYECPKCGDVWRGIEIVEHIDCDRDSVEHVPTCSCGRAVREKFVTDATGKRTPVWHALNDEEIEVDMQTLDDWDHNS